MGRHEPERFPSPAALARAVAERWLSILASSSSANAPFTVALSGGRIARDLFSHAASAAKQRGLTLANVDFFWGDERCVPPDDAESNFRAANELLLAPLAIPLARIHRVRGEADPDTAAQEAAVELLRVAPMDNAGQPVLDLVFLGMGEDGHVASLFPGESDEVMNSVAVYRAVTASKPPPRRITLGYATLAAAREVWVLASGAGKAEALRESLRPDGCTPLARLLRMRERTTIFTDITAASSAGKG
jgi:6-phosphogluconolactonase